jgi:CRISPR/Cas system-associated protein Cas5 (RAMP superfamily)
VAKFKVLLGQQGDEDYPLSSHSTFIGALRAAARIYRRKLKRLIHPDTYAYIEMPGGRRLNWPFVG